MRVLALDWGTVRIGAAISDETGKIAFPLDKFIESKNAIEAIAKIVEEKSVDQIIIGLPRSLSGRSNDSTDKVGQFKSALARRVKCNIEYIDERLSSVGAAKTLSQQGLNAKKQRGLVDNLAAQQLLSAYLDTKNN
jgi:putative Holliday junction resolvase